MNSSNHLLDSLIEQGVCAGGTQSEDIEFVEQLFGLRFPESYKLFLSQCGALSVGSLFINGLGVPFDSPVSLVNALNALQTVCPNAPEGLIPIRVIGPGLLHCIFCDAPSSDLADAPIYLFDVETATIKSSPEYDGFVPYLQECLRALDGSDAYLVNRKLYDSGLSRMKWHVKVFEEEYLNVGKIPRNHVWRPYRFCVQDVILGLVVLKHSLKNNNLEVDVCLTSDAPDYEMHNGAKMTMAFLLSEAYKCGGSMEIQFTKHVENKKVPYSICDLAEYLGVRLNHIEEGRITISEAQNFYMALTDFPPLLFDRIVELSSAGKLSKESVCYAVNRGIWTKSQVESIVFGSQNPESIFKGAAYSEQRHLYQHDLYHARSAILGEYLDQKLMKRERSDGNTAIDLEDDVRRLQIRFNREYYAKVYQSEDELILPWIRNGINQRRIVPVNNDLIVLIRARDVSQLKYGIHLDLQAALSISEKLEEKVSKPFIFILYPRDFEDLIFGENKELISEVEESGVGIMICPEAVTSIEMDAINRLARSRILRQ